MKPLNYEIELQKVNDAITLNEHNLKTFNVIRGVLEDFDGKTITKRIATAIGKALPGYVVHWNKDYSWWQVVVWKDNYDDRQSYNLRYFSEGDGFEMSRFDEMNVCHSLDESRLVKMKRFKRLLRGWVHKHNKAVKLLGEIYDECGDTYPYSSTFRAGYRHAEVK